MEMNYIRSKGLATREQTTSASSYPMPLKSRLLTKAEIKTKIQQNEHKYQTQSGMVYRVGSTQESVQTYATSGRVLQSASFHPAIEQGTVRKRILKENVAIREDGKLERRQNPATIPSQIQQLMR